MASTVSKCRDLDGVRIAMFSFFNRGNGKPKAVTIPVTPLSSAYTKEFHRQIAMYRPQLIERRGLTQEATMLAIFDDFLVLAMHQVAWLWALNESGSHFRGRNAHRDRGHLKAELDNGTYEWCQLAYAAHLTGRSQLRLWNKLCQTADANPRTPLRHTAMSLKGLGIDKPPFVPLVGDGGGLLNP